MSESTATGVDLTVTGARKRDAGRGIARLPESARSRLGVLSGDPVVVEGERRTVVKVWPADDDGAFVRIDADTRANAGATVGDDVTVRNASVEDAASVVVTPAESLPAAATEATVAAGLVDRLVQPGDRVHVDGVGALSVQETTPDGSVRVAEDSRVRLAGTDRANGSAEANGTDSESDGAAGGDATTPAGSTPAEATVGDGPAVTYEDIGGLDSELDQVRETIEVPLTEPDRFRELGVEPPGGVLLYGPPGTGKTLIARAAANEVDANFEAISGPEVVSKYKGESEERLREAFERATEHAPSILFVDEIDSIAGARDEDADMENRVVAQLLTLMDGLEDREQVVVVGATNRVDAVDEALRRGGRFDREIEIGVPDEAGRREILDVHTREMPLGEGIDLDRVAARTHGFVGADLRSLATEAALTALRRDEDDPVVTRSDVEAALAAVEPSAMREFVAESPTVTFDDVGGLATAKETLERAVEWPLSYGPLFDATGTDPPTGVLLYGPPGTGKTLLARAIAGETGVNFVSVAGPELLDRYVGESEEAVRELFDRARQTAPGIVFVDELDAVAGNRGDSHEVTDRVVSQLLSELDGAAENPNLVVLAATNRRDAIDDALLRPGRLEEHVHVPAPDADARRAILAVHTEGRPLGEDVDLDALAEATADWSGAELEALVRSAALDAIEDVASEVDPDAVDEHADDVTITARHFEAAVERARDR